jgi:CRP-like cAMP-binding protein
MTAQNILANIGKFTSAEIALFEKLTAKKTFNKNDILLKEGEVCQAVFFILSGCFFQFQPAEITETIIDLHVQKEWMFNHQSLIEQSPSKTGIRAFAKSEVIELSLYSLHCLIARSQAFLNLGRIFNQVNSRTYLFDNALNPAQKYNYIKEARPLLAQMFPIKMIASYLKIAPETLSRVRANY